jgi:prophage regulatory protein
VATKTDSNHDLPVILRLPAVRKATGYPTSTIYRLIAERRFPRQVSLGPKSVGWVEREVHEWIAARIAARDGEGV